MSVLLPYQARWYADDAPLRVCQKARRIGITWAEAARQVMWAARSRSAGGGDCYYVSTSHRLGREYVEEVASWAVELNAAATLIGDTMIDEGGGVLTHEVRFASGHKIVAVTSNPAAFRGLGGRVCVDEAAHHKNLYELLKAAGYITSWGGEVSVISTHNGRENPFNLLCEEVAGGKRAGAMHRITIHDAYLDGLFRRRCRVNGWEWSQEREAADLAAELAKWGAEEELLCVPASSGVVYIRRDLIDACSRPAPVVRLDLPDGWVLRDQAEKEQEIGRWCEAQVAPLLAGLSRAKATSIGVDFARSSDLTVIAPMVEDFDTRKIVPWLLELRAVPHNQQWQILEFVGRWISQKTRWVGVAVDQGANGDWLAEQALITWGEERAAKVALTSAWWDREPPRLLTLFEEHQIAIPADVDVRDDVLMLRYTSKGVRLGDDRRPDSRTGKPRHGDAAVAILLAHQRHGEPVPTTSGLRPVKPLGDRERSRLRGRRQRL